MSLSSETEPLLANERERRDEECGPYLSANYPRAGGRVDAIDGLRPLLALWIMLCESSMPHASWRREVGTFSRLARPQLHDATCPSIS